MMKLFVVGFQALTSIREMYWWGLATLMKLFNVMINGRRKKRSERATLLATEMPLKASSKKLVAESSKPQLRIKAGWYWYKSSAIAKGCSYSPFREMLETLGTLAVTDFPVERGILDKWALLSK